MTNEINFINIVKSSAADATTKITADEVLTQVDAPQRTCLLFTYQVVLDEHAPPGRIRNYLNQFDGTSFLITFLPPCRP